MKHSEVGNGRFDRRSAVDCFVLERHPSLAVGSLKKTRGISVKRWVNYFLGFSLRDWPGSYWVVGMFPNRV